MQPRHFTLALLLTCALAPAAQAEDLRQRVDLPPPAQETLRQEMRDNLLALNDILAHLAAGELTEAGELAESRLGKGAMGKNRALPMEARPAAHMPAAMHQLGIDGHMAASNFAAAARAGDRDKAMVQLATLTASCVACHYAYRIR